MITALIIEIVLYAVCVALVCVLWERPLALLACSVVLSALLLRRWHSKGDVVFYCAGVLFGTVADWSGVQSGAWHYNAVSGAIPLWLPFMWGIVPLLLKKMSETLTGSQ